ncbi:SRPBCC family protein [Rhodococcus aerolatus]
MASLTVTEELPMSPAQAWAAASDLGRFEQWMTIHAGWLSPLPDHLEQGTQVSSKVTMVGVSNRIDWTVTRYDEPTRISLTGRGRGGVRIALDMTVSGSGDSCSVTMAAEFGGGILRGPVSSVVRRALRGDMHRSVRNLAKVS